MRSALTIVVLGLLIGCTTVPDETGAAVFVGHYSMIKGGFNEALNVELSEDGSYVLEHELFACVIGPNGELPITYSREEGTWKFEDGFIALEPTARTDGFPDTRVFAPALAHRLMAKRDGSTRLLVNAEFPEQFILKKTKHPKRLFERE